MADTNDLKILKNNKNNSFSLEEHIKQNGFAPMSFSNEQMENLQLAGLSLYFPKVIGSNLSGARFEGTLFVNPDFSGSMLKGASFENCVLFSPCFDECDFSETTFKNTVIIKGLFSKAKNFNTASFKKTNINRCVLPQNCLKVEFIEVDYHFDLKRILKLFAEIDARGQRKRIVLSSRLGRATIFFASRCFSNLYDVYETLVLSRKSSRDTQAGFVALFINILLVINSLLKTIVNSYMSFILKSLEFISWPLVRSYGALQVLTKASYAFLLTIPILAAVWPMIRAYVSMYNQSISEATTSATKMISQVKNLSQNEQYHEKIQLILLQFENMSKDLSMSTEINLPLTPVAIFFAALCVVLGHLLFETRADDIVKKYSRANYLEKVMSQFKRSDPVIQTNLLERSIYFINILSTKKPDFLHENFSNFRKQPMWIPSHADEFSNSHDPLLEDRKLIATEFGAHCEYETLIRKNIGSALVSFVLYGVATGLIIFVIYSQALNILIQAGLISSFSG